MKLILKYFGYFLITTLILIQFFRPQKNIAASATAAQIDVSDVYHVPASVQKVLEASCYDCHSNNTRYPWYANIQPVAWWLADHVKEGKKELNFSSFADYSIRRKYRKLEEVIKEIKEDEMPLTSYKLAHWDASLTKTQKQEIITWATAIRDTMQARYPKDSLERKLPATNRLSTIK